VRRHEESVIQKLRCEVRAIVPRDCIEFRAKLESRELRLVGERRERFSVKLPGKVNVTLSPIVESEIDHVIMFVSGFDNVQNHGLPPKKLLTISIRAYSLFGECIARSSLFW